MQWACIRRALDICWTCIGHIFHTCIGHALDMHWTCVGHALGYSCDSPEFSQKNKYGLVRLLDRILVLRTSWPTQGLLFVAVLENNRARNE